MEGTWCFYILIGNYICMLNFYKTLRFQVEYGKRLFTRCSAYFLPDAFIAIFRPVVYRIPETAEFHFLEIWSICNYEYKLVSSSAFFPVSP